MIGWIVTFCWLINDCKFDVGVSCFWTHSPSFLLNLGNEELLGMLTFFFFSMCRFWITVAHLVSPMKLVASNIPTDGWVYSLLHLAYLPRMSSKVLLLSVYVKNQILILFLKPLNLYIRGLLLVEFDIA